MLYLILAIMSSSLIAVIMRISTGKVKANFSMLAVNYITCLILSVIYAGFRILPLGAEGQTVKKVCISRCRGRRPRRPGGKTL